MALLTKASQTPNRWVFSNRLNCLRLSHCRRWTGNVWHVITSDLHYTTRTVLAASCPPRKVQDGITDMCGSQPSLPSVHQRSTDTSQ